MKSLRYLTLALLLVFTLMLAGCSDLSNKLFGAWKSEAVSATTGKPVIVLLDKDSLTMDGKTIPVVYHVFAVNVDVIDSATSQYLLTAENIENSSAVFRGGRFHGQGQVKFLRIPNEEAKKLLE